MEEPPSGLELSLKCLPSPWEVLGKISNSLLCLLHQEMTPYCLEVHLGWPQRHLKAAILCSEYGRKLL